MKRAGWEERMEEDVARHSQLDGNGRVGDEPAAVQSNVTAERSCRTEEAGQPRSRLTYNLTAAALHLKMFMSQWVFTLKSEKQK